jgi:tetratricopeptide (TPR) repeat protein
MPSLQALRDFKLSFDDIGGERAALEEQNLPFEDLPLPEIEAELPDAAATEETERAEALAALAGMDLDPAVAASLGLPEATPGLPQAAPPEAAPDSPFSADSPEAIETAAADAAQGDFDLDALLGSVPGDLTEIPGEDAGIPPELLDGFADEVEKSPPDAELETGGLEEAEFPEAPPAGAGETGLDLEDLGDLALDGADLDLEEGEPEEAGGPEIDLSGLEDLDLEEGEPGGGSPEAPEIPEAPPGPETGEAPGTPAAASAGEAPPEDLESFGGLDVSDLADLGDLAGDMDFDAGDLAGAAEEGPAGDAALDLSAGDTNALDLNLEGGFGEEDLLTGGDDSFDSFDVDESSPAEEEEDSGAGMDLGDFTLPGIDDMLGGIPGEAPPKPGRGRESFFSRPPAEETVEEISLDETDLANFRRTLASYPLNLRLAVEEIIAERAAPPEQMGSLVRLLVQGALPRETAALAGKILDRVIQIPRGFQKKTGEQMEAERGSFAYIFVRKFLPIFGLFLFIVLTAASSFYLIWRFIYMPIRAENIYRLGYDRIAAGEYERANQRFSQAFDIRRDKKWFYRYAEAFRDQRQYLYAEEKYDELLRWYPRDKKGVLDYAAMETYYQWNYEKADLLLRRNILEYNPNDPEALLAQGDNALAWGEIDPPRYEDARFAYARLLDRYGWTDPVAERMLKYFIRTDNLKEVIPLQFFFMDNPKKEISAETLAELGGYLLDKRTEEVRGVPNEYREQISNVRDVLLRAVLLGPGLPEAHYHLSRYYRNLGSTREEQLTLEVALRAFESAAEESARRGVYHIEALKRDAEILTEKREYFKAEEKLVKAVGLYENILERGLLAPAARFGQLYAALGDLEYFTKSGDMEMSLSYYREAEKNGYAPPEMLYRMGAAHYQQEEWAPALERFFAASLKLPLNRRLLLALGNTCYQRGDFYAAHAYYSFLLDILEAERSRLPVLLPNDRPEYLELAERLMISRNNMGAALESLARHGGSPRYLAQAGGFYAQAVQAWDALTRNPQTMIRLGAGDLSNPGASLPYLNSRNILYPQTGYEPQLFVRIDRDVLDPSPWED